MKVKLSSKQCPSMSFCRSFCDLNISCRSSGTYACEFFGDLSFNSFRSMVTVRSVDTLSLPTRVPYNLKKYGNFSIPIWYSVLWYYNCSNNLRKETALAFSKYYNLLFTEIFSFVQWFLLTRSSKISFGRYFVRTPLTVIR